jgi:hypothetical protein
MLSQQRKPIMKPYSKPRSKITTHKKYESGEPVEVKLEETFTYFEGRMFRCENRWAKVMYTKLTKEPLVSVALGRDGEYRAFAVYSNRDGGHETLTLKTAKEMAIDWAVQGLGV